MKKNLIFTFFILMILLSIILNPQKYISITLNAINIWATVLLPALFPFFVFTKMITILGYTENISYSFKNLTYKLYKAPPISSYVFVMSILTGYPVGSKLIADLYNNKKISKLDAKKTITFTSNSGPMFIIGSVGIGMLLNKKCGYIIYFSHILGAFFNGILYRNLKEKNNKNNLIINNKNNYQNNTNKTNNFNFSDIIFDSIKSILTIGGIIAISFITIEVFNDLNIFYPIFKTFNLMGFNTNILNAIFNGFLEMTNGCLNIKLLNISLKLKTILSCLIISFGGLSTTFQAMAFLNKIVSFKFFILQKITHTIISTIICVILAFLFI